ncbi:G5 domain-containing protein [Microbacterium gilvum]|uniref:G5 domain-containing protein n=1 Tax=Microbacterium gilvum TaxID=1336204 RepID=A0ABP9A3Y3_9MICO
MDHPRRERRPVFGRTPRPVLWMIATVGAIVALVALRPIFLLAAVAVLILGILALAKATPRARPFRSRKTAAVATTLAAAALIVGGSVSAADRPPVEATVVSNADDGAADDAAAPSPETPSPSPEATPTPVTITREEIVTEEIAFDRVTVEDGTRPHGESSVTAVGRPGERSLTYRITEVDGQEVGRELLSEAVTVEPQPEVTTVGTYVAPPEPAPVEAATGCDPNYADGCVPIAADVDCAGGSGDGPAYFEGTATVVGADIYDLDRDGDGIACQN